MDLCDNTSGSYQCYCQDGYELSSDDYNCTGMYVDDEMSDATFDISTFV